MLLDRLEIICFFVLFCPSASRSVLTNGSLARWIGAMCARPRTWPTHLGMYFKLQDDTENFILTEAKRRRDSDVTSPINFSPVFHLKLFYLRCNIGYAYKLSSHIFQRLASFLSVNYARENELKLHRCLSFTEYIISTLHIKEQDSDYIHIYLS